MRQRSAEEIVVIYLMKKTIVGLFEKEKLHRNSERRQEMDSRDLWHFTSQ